MDFGRDEEERKREQAVARERAKGEAGASLIEHMRLVGKLDGLREQQTLQKQLQLAAQLGDADKVRQLQAKLAPDDPRKGLAQQNYGARWRGASGAPDGPLTRFLPQDFVRRGDRCRLGRARANLLPHARVTGGWGAKAWFGEQRNGPASSTGWPLSVKAGTAVRPVVPAPPRVKHRRCSARGGCPPARLARPRVAATMPGISKSSKLLGYVNFRCGRARRASGSRTEPAGDGYARRARGKRRHAGVARADECVATSLVARSMRITILDGRHIVGRFMAFDRHMNIVLGDAEEFRRLPPKKGVPESEREIRRPLGLVLIRGEEVVSLTVEGPPPTDDRRGKRDVAPVRARLSLA